MKPGLCVSLALLLACPNLVLAECQLTASQQNLAYGKMSPAERQSQKTTKITLAAKKVVVQVTCDTPSRIRLFISSHLPSGDRFGFGTRGTMNISAINGYLDDRAVKLSKVRTAIDAVSDAGQSSVTLAVNDGLAFVDGSELSGRQATVIFSVIPSFEKEPITDSTAYTGHLNIRVEAQ